MATHYNVKRIGSPNESPIDIPASDLAETLKRNPKWRIIDETQKTDVKVDAPKKPETQEVECPICGKKYKNEHGLKIHKAAH